MQGWNFTDASLVSVYNENGHNTETVNITDDIMKRMWDSAVETLAQLHLYQGNDFIDIQDDTDNGPGNIRSFWTWRVSYVVIAMTLCMHSCPITQCSMHSLG